MDVESDKFRDALIAVMTQRIQDYLKVKYGTFKEIEVQNIVLSTDFKRIYDEQTADFKIEYKKYIQTESPSFMD